MADATIFQPATVPGVYGFYPNLNLGMYNREDLRQRTNYQPLPPTTTELEALLVRAEAWAEVALQAQAAPLRRGQDRSIPPPPAVPNATELTDVPQGTVLWHILRQRRVTASKIAALLGVLEEESASYLRDEQVKLATPKPSKEHMQSAYESFRDTAPPCWPPEIKNHEHGAEVCAMEMGMNGEATAMQTYLDWLMREHPGWHVQEAGVAHLTQLPPSMAVDGISLEQLPPIMVSPDGYVVRPKRVWYQCRVWSKLPRKAERWEGYVTSIAKLY